MVFGKASISYLTFSVSTFDDNNNIFIESNNNGIEALINIITMIHEPVGSAYGAKLDSPANLTTKAAAIATTLPKKSPKTCKKTPYKAISLCFFYFFSFLSFLPFLSFFSSFFPSCGYSLATSTVSASCLCESHELSECSCS